MLGLPFASFFFLQTCDFFSNSGAGDVLSHPNQIARFVGRPFRFQPNTARVALLHSERHIFKSMKHSGTKHLLRSVSGFVGCDGLTMMDGDFFVTLEIPNFFRKDE